jgi:hypothetical protein
VERRVMIHDANALASKESVTSIQVHSRSVYISILHHITLHYTPYIVIASCIYHYCG